LGLLTTRFPNGFDGQAPLHGCDRSIPNSTVG
jgi:hypothetical protein